MSGIHHCTNKKQTVIFSVRLSAFCALQVAAVHAQRLPGDEAGVIREQEYRRFGDVLARAEPSQRGFVRENLLGFLAVFIHHLCIDHAGGNAVNSHAAGAQLFGQRLRQADDRGLAGGICWRW